MHSVNLSTSFQTHFCLVLFHKKQPNPKKHRKPYKTLKKKKKNLPKTQLEKMVAACLPPLSFSKPRLGEALNKLAAEDPSFRYSRDEESNQTVIEGMGALGVFFFFFLGGGGGEGFRFFSTKKNVWIWELFGVSNQKSGGLGGVLTPFETSPWLRPA